VQLDPIKPILKAPGTKRLKLQYDEPLSNFAVEFNLRRDTVEGQLLTVDYLVNTCHADVNIADRWHSTAFQAGAYTRSLSSSTCNLSRFLHKIHPKHPLIPPHTPLHPLTPPSTPQTSPKQPEMYPLSHRKSLS